MKSKTIGYMILPVILIVMLVFLVSAADYITWNDPANESQVRWSSVTTGQGNGEKLNITTHHQDTGAVEFQINCTETTGNWSTNFSGTTTAYRINWTNRGSDGGSGENTNTTGGDNFTGRLNTTFINDGICTIRANTSNTSSSLWVYIDKSVPNTPSGLSPLAEASLSGSDASELIFSGTITDVNTTGCGLVFSGSTMPEQSTYTMSAANGATSCSKTLYSFPSGTFTYVIRATDGLNTTDSASTSFSVKRDSKGSISGGTGALAPSAIAAKQAAAAKKPMPIGTIVVLGIAVFIAWKFLIKKGRK